MIADVLVKVIIALSVSALRFVISFLIDSFPISVCDKYRIKRNKLYGDKMYRGYIPSKKRYFYGLKVYIMVTQTGEPVEFFLTPGSFADVSATPLYDYDLPKGAVVYGERAYNLSNQQ